MVTNPFALIEPDLRQLERELSQIIGDYDKCVTTKYWPQYWQREARVRAVERSLRRSGATGCVFGSERPCKERVISNCDACTPEGGGKVKITKHIVGRAKDGVLWDVDTLAF